jgi:hypothetical protein
MMKSVRMSVLALLALAGAGGLALQAQEVVHAVTGIVTAVYPDKDQLTIKTNDDSGGDFQYEKELKTDIEFDKAVREGTVKPNDFNKIGDHVVAYYFGNGQKRTIVGIKDFGSAGLKVASGTLVTVKHHALSVKTDAGATETFDIAKDASAETSVGVISGLKFGADEGTRVTVRYTDANGQKLAQFIRAD